MRERPILMSGPLVREILAGRKTVTRRPVKPQPQPNGGAGLHSVAPYCNPDGDWAWVLAATGHGSGGNAFPCPYGHPGDRLWVRETHAHGTMNGGGRQWVRYRATDEGSLPAGAHWTPSIHLPRALARLVLDVLGVRVERLHEITDEDARREGVADRAAFVAKWHEIYGAESWDENPWVWRIEFRRVEAERSAA
jgi:hypothetical protein